MALALFSLTLLSVASLLAVLIAYRSVWCLFWRLRQFFVLLGFLCAGVVVAESFWLVNHPPVMAGLIQHRLWISVGFRVGLLWGLAMLWRHLPRMNDQGLDHVRNSFMHD